MQNQTDTNPKKQNEAANFLQLKQTIKKIQSKQDFA